MWAIVEDCRNKNASWTLGYIVQYISFLSAQSKGMNLHTTSAYYQENDTSDESLKTQKCTNVCNLASPLPAVVCHTEVYTQDRYCSLNQNPSNNVTDLCVLKDVSTKLDAYQGFNTHTQSIHPTLCPHSFASWVSHVAVVLPVKE